MHSIIHASAHSKLLICQNMHEITTFSTYNIHKHLRAEEANAAQHFDSLGQKRLMKNWFGKFNMSKVTGAIGHIARTCLTTRLSVYHTLAWIHQTVQLWSTTFHRLRMADSSISYRHATLTPHIDSHLL